MKRILKVALQVLLFLPVFSYGQQLTEFADVIFNNEKVVLKVGGNSIAMNSFDLIPNTYKKDLLVIEISMQDVPISKSIVNNSFSRITDDIRAFELQTSNTADQLLFLRKCALVAILRNNLLPETVLPKLGKLSESGNNVIEQNSKLVEEVVKFYNEE